MDCFTNVKGHPVHYVEYGEGKPVLNIHGYEVDYRMMSGCLEPVFEKKDGYRRIYVDLPGMGQTPPGELKSADDWLNLLDGFIDEVIGKEHFLLTGQSYGCYLQLGLIYKRGSQIDGCFFIAPCTIAKRAPRQLPVKQFIEQDKKFLDTLQENGKEDYLDWSVILNKKTWRIFERDMYCGMKLFDPEYLDFIAANGYELSMEKEFDDMVFEGPCCWVMARQDQFVGCKDQWRFLDHFPRSAYIVLDGCGHNMPIEKEDLFYLLVEDWLYRLEKLQPIEYFPDWKVLPAVERDAWKKRK